MEAPAWLIDGFGVIAGLCSIASFPLQIVKIVRERQAKGVSLHMYVVTFIGFACWTAYGALSDAWPVAVANAICVCLVAIILMLRLRYGRHDS